MSHNVGGIHVRTKTGLTPAQVAKAIAEYFTRRGAKRSTRGVRALPVLGLETSGKLGIVIAPVENGWFTIADSEGYSSSHGLATALASALGVEVIRWEVNGATDTASLVRLGADGDLPIESEVDPADRTTPDGVEEMLVELAVPNALARFQDFATLRGARLTWLGFNGVTPAAYHGVEESNAIEDEEPIAHEDTRWFDAALALLAEVLTIPHVPRLQRAWSYTLAASKRCDDNNDPMLAYPRTGLDHLFYEITLHDPARAVRVLCEFTGWTDEVPPSHAAATGNEWRALANAFAATGSGERAKVALARYFILDLDQVWHSNSVDLLKQLGEVADAKTLEAIDKACARNQPVGVTPVMSAFVDRWYALPLLATLSTAALVKNRERAHTLARETQHLDVEIKRRAAILRRVASDIGALDEINWPLSKDDGWWLDKHASEIVTARPADARVLAQRAMEREPASALATIFRASSATGAAADTYVPAAYLYGRYKPRDALRAAASYLVRCGRTREAIAALREAKTVRDRELFRALDDPELRALATDPEFRAIFDERVHSRKAELVFSGEAHGVFVAWALTFDTAGPHIRALLDRYVERFESELRFGNTSVNSSERKPFSRAMLTRARGACEGVAAKKHFVSFVLRDTEYGAYGHSFGCLGGTDGYSCAWLTFPTSAHATGEGLFAEVVELVERAGPIAYGHADVALTADTLSGDAFEDELAMQTRLHPGLDIELGAYASSIHLFPDNVPNARWVSFIGHDLQRKLKEPPALSTQRIGEVLVVRAGEAPDRGNLIDPEPTWYVPRRALAAYLKPVADTGYHGPHEYVEGGREGWAKRWW